MQVSDMRILTRIYSVATNLAASSSHSHSSRAASFVPFKPRQNPQFSRQIYCSPPLRSSQCSADRIRASPSWAADSETADNSSPSTSASATYNPSVEAVYDPLSGRMRTVRSSFQNGNRDSGGENDAASNFASGDAEGPRVYGDIIGRGKKKGKSKAVWLCSNCGNSFGQWWGSCPSCKQVGAVKQFSVAGDVESYAASSDGKVSGLKVSENLAWSWFGQNSADNGPMRLVDVNRGINPSDWRIPLSGLFGAEVGRVLGGGVVPGSLILVGGDPGVGKSTLLLQIAGIISGGHDMGGSAPVVYVSGEESIEQIGNRADRMKIGASELFLYSATDIEDILDKARPLYPRALVVDSIQTVYLHGVTGSAGSISQVRECTSALLRFAKKTNIPILLAGHVTKSGDIAGPRVLEHIVDVVLYMEGEKFSSYRLLRSVKNRFGSTDELGVLEMSQSGLQAVTNPSEIFLSEQHLDSEFLAGLAVAVIMDGSRAFVIEIQALCVAGSSFARQVNGVQASKADMIISVLKKQAGLRLQENGIFLNVVSGVNLSETAGDLAIAAAICSSFLEYPIPKGVAFIGEIGLGGELRVVPRMEKRVATLAKLGYKKCVVPQSTEKFLSAIDVGGIEIVGCRNLKEVINKVFKKMRFEADSA